MQQGSAQDVTSNEPVVPNKSAKELNRANSLTFMNLRQDFRNDFASRVLQPVDVAPRIEAMVTAATNAIFEEGRNINWILYELVRAVKSKPLSTAEALTFIWIYVGTAETVAKRNGPFDLPRVLDSQLGCLFTRAVSHDKEKNMPHVAHLWRTARHFHRPMAEFPLHERILKKAYGRGVDLDNVPTPEAGVVQLFEEMSLYGDNVEEDCVGTFPGKKIQVAKSVKPEANDNSTQEIGTSSLKKWKPRYRNRQKVSQQLDQDITPIAIMEPWTFCCCVDSPENVVPGKESSQETEDKSIKPGNVEMPSTSKSRLLDFFQQQTSNSPAANAPKNKSDYYFRLFLTNPGEYIRLNPTLFPPSDAAWSAKKLLPDQETKSNPVDDDPISEVAQTPADCTETLLSVDFTPDEYIAQLKASNYYAHGVRIVDGERRLVVYHKIINPSGIKKEPI
ncbi:uncharacterized protein LOC118437354 [Folsomia candida]|uniref:Uncharacterized protein n=1 Tax=Folsomia candida TaxID=158441 RepID=A0A226DNZ0_FOLCA|nr:uncharacterized protein LOC118437354 [Folsomia candida]OXA47252.1 hypothetical protein Fcan01_18032 [Folsomia candida]